MNEAKHVLELTMQDQMHCIIMERMYRRVRIFTEYREIIKFICRAKKERYARDIYAHF